VTALDLSLDVSAVPVHPGGAGQYTLALARGLVARPDVHLTLVTRRGDAARWDVIGAAQVRSDVPSSRPGRLAFEQVALPAVLRSAGVSVHHGPHYTMPARSPVPVAVTIHDCTFFDHPEWHLRSKAAFFRRAIRRAALRADVLICVSGVTAERLAANVTVRAPVVVAPHGVDHDRFSPSEPGTGADGVLLHELGVPVDRPLVAFVGTLEPRKGVVPLIAAFDALAASHPDVVLVLAGQTGWGMAETEQALAAARHADRIVRTGYLPDAAVPALLRQAAVVAYPALEEGFGLPALEALACGAPLVTTVGTAMAELAGAAALLVPPASVTPLAEALETALDQGRHSDRRERGFAVAAARTWRASVDEHLRAYALAESASQ
jgi:glycosyltransferase involved in cell wall biosynthesis